jgi:hypothetical protein
MQHTLLRPTAESLPNSHFNYLKESGFFSVYCRVRGKTPVSPSAHEYGCKGLFANELNQAYFFCVSKCNS